MSEKLIGMTLRLVVHGSERDLMQAESQMKEDCPSLSFSPWIEREELDGCLEARGSARISQETKERILAGWNDDWDISEDEDCYSAYGFNTKMFDSHVYYLQLQF